MQHAVDCIAHLLVLVFQRAADFDNPTYGEISESDFPNNARRRGTGGYEQPFQAEAVARNPFYASADDVLKGKSDNDYDSADFISPYDNTGSLSSNRNAYDNPEGVRSSGSTSNPYDNSGSLRSQQAGGDVNVYDNPTDNRSPLYEEL